MTRLADLHASVETTLASKRLGTPLFVRYLFQSQDKNGVILARLTQVAGTIRDWMGQPIERVYAQGQVKSRLVQLTLEFRGGGSALVGWSAGPGRGDGVDLLILGNRGSLTYDAGTGLLWDMALASLDDKADPALQELIERAMRSGRPERVRR
jgi:hypothetical protein